jgi:hypothetical protein
MDAQAGFPACGTGRRAQDSAMNSTFWIAAGAAIIVVLAHIALFWWFLVRKGKDNDQT